MSRGPTATLSRFEAAFFAQLGRYDHLTRPLNRLQFIDHFAGFAQPARPNMPVLVTLADAKHYNEVLCALGMAFAEDFVRAGATLLGSLLPSGTMLYHVSVLSFIAAVPVDDIEQCPEIAFAGAIVVNAIPIKSQLGVGDARRDAPAMARRPIQGLTSASNVTLTFI